MKRQESLLGESCLDGDYLLCVLFCVGLEMTFLINEGDIMEAPYTRIYD